jgi:hypothetical protein
MDQPFCDLLEKHLFIVTEPRSIKIQIEEPHHTVKQETFHEVENEKKPEKICLTVPSVQTGKCVF